METVLITGGSGTIGTKLSALLVEKGYAVRHLSRSPTGKEKYPSFKWDLKKQYIDPKALENVDHLIHLAGSGIADKRWTDDRKKDLISSRVDSMNLLHQKFADKGTKLKTVVSSSGINYYGFAESEKIFTEKDPPGNDFLSDVCIKWENAALQFKSTSRVVLMRTAIVLSPKGGALEKLAQPIRFFVGSPLGSGKQWMPWIHLDDICGMYVHALESNIEGPINAVAPESKTNKEFTQLVAKTLRKPLLMPNIPAFALKLALGELSVVLLNGNRADCGKIVESGFTFNFPTLEEALQNLLT